MSNSIHELSQWGGIDLGGTKIEATLFDAALNPIDKRRRPTPRSSYAELLDALGEEIAWLRRCANSPQLAVGLALPGLVEIATGYSITSNLPANGRPLGADLIKRSGGTIMLANDCKCFTLSEANGGAGDGFSTVFGIIMGTGLGGGMCINGRLCKSTNNLAGEIGHAALPATVIVQHQLPLLPCGCGRQGCYETFLSGTGLSQLGQVLGGVALDAPAIVARAGAGDATMIQVWNTWTALAGEFLHMLQLHLDPECIVLGGGLSNIDQIEVSLRQALEQSALPSLQLPVILKPRFGDSSGGRGAALLAQQTKRDKQESSP